MDEEIQVMDCKNIGLEMWNNRALILKQKSGCTSLNQCTFACGNSAYSLTSCYPLAPVNCDEIVLDQYLIHIILCNLK